MKSQVFCKNSELLQISTIRVQIDVFDQKMVNFNEKMEKEKS